FAEGAEVFTAGRRHGGPFGSQVQVEAQLEPDPRE
ncbi:MAG: hypothetical protein RL760_51, partial [Candidatus Eisenbacteria bacterium]